MDELALYIVPPGQGVYAVTTGKAELAERTARYLGASFDPTGRWREHLERAVLEPVALLAIPSDTGAGIVRGAARGPEAIRDKLGGAPVADLGDVFTVPHLLDDAMLSRTQIEACQDALYASVELGRRRSLPVSPLSTAGRALELLAALNPRQKIMMLGGDHTVTWPVIAHVIARDPRPEELGILHFDAHTDLSPERLGVAICFATWAYHANRLLGAQGRLLQVGIRASGYSRDHWERAEGVRQIWASEALGLGAEGLAGAVVEHFRERGVRRLYVTNDIDGTDSYFAAACGTPEPNGLTPELVVRTLAAVGAAGFDVVGADLVELAPGLSLDRAASERSVATAAEYVRASLELLR